MTLLRKIIINADDYGLSKQFNRGILELIERGIVTSTTVMIKRKFINPKDLLKHKNISIGLHLELSLETPAKEIENQIKIFRKLFGRFPSHLDGHKYYHLLPGNFSKVLKIAKKYKLPVRSASSIDQKMMQAAGIKTPDQFISWHPNRKEKLFKNLKSARGETIELLCHPGYYDSKATTSYNKQREKELKALESQHFEKILENFTPINYEQA
ncbi:MAG: ChbG/HpnK family deacetylase [Candidatus Moranbacteria bacterium]|nr:ChbG/HpnK family deacetylase [Candidatus Moranbacteria bacterium]